LGNANAEAAAAAAGAAEDGPGAAMGAAAGTAVQVRPPRAANRGTMTRGQRKNWKLRQWESAENELRR